MALGQRGVDAAARQEAVTQPGDLQRDLGLDVRHGDTRLPGVQADAARRQQARAVGDDDRRVRAQVFGRQRAVDARQRVLRCDAENEFDVLQALGLLGKAGGRIADGQDQVGAAFAQGLPAAGHDFGADAQARAAVQRLEGADVLDQGRGGQQRVMHQAQFGFVTGGDAAQARFEIGGGTQQPAAFPEQFAADRGQRDARPAPHEELETELLFELGHGVGNRRRHLVQGFRRRGKRAAAIDGIDDFDRVERQLEHGERFNIRKIRL